VPAAAAPPNIAAMERAENTIADCGKSQRFHAASTSSTNTSSASRITPVRDAATTTDAAKTAATPTNKPLRSRWRMARKSAIGKVSSTNAAKWLR